MDRSRSPRVLHPRNVGYGQDSYYPPLAVMTQADALAVPGAIGALWVGPPTPDGVPTDQEQNARMWLPLFAPQQPFTGQGNHLGE